MRSLLVAIIVSLSLAVGGSTAEGKPNVVFVLVDDLGYSDVGFHNPAIKTPNFEKLVNEGLVLGTSSLRVQVLLAFASVISNRTLASPRPPVQYSPRCSYWRQYQHDHASCKAEESWIQD